MGVDPSLKHTGVAIVRETEHGAWRVVDFEDIVTDEKQSHESRLWTLYQSLSDLIVEYEPEVIASEKVVFVQSRKTAIILGQARGAMMVAAGEYCVPVHDIPTTKVKKAITGKGNAKKEEVAEVIHRSYSDIQNLSLDVTDAAACAITWLKEDASRERDDFQRDT